MKESLIVKVTNINIGDENPHSITPEGVDGFMVYPHDPQSVVRALKHIQRCIKIPLINVPGKMTWMQGHPTAELEQVVQKLFEATSWLRDYMEKTERDNDFIVRMFLTSGFPKPAIQCEPKEESPNAPN